MNLQENIQRIREMIGLEERIGVRSVYRTIIRIKLKMKKNYILTIFLGINIILNDIIF